MPEPSAFPARRHGRADGGGGPERLKVWAYPDSRAQGLAISRSWGQRIMRFRAMRPGDGAVSGWKWGRMGLGCEGRGEYQWGSGGIWGIWRRKRRRRRRKKRKMTINPF